LPLGGLVSNGGYDDDTDRLVIRHSSLVIRSNDFDLEFLQSLFYPVQSIRVAK
jgi:hypothetical protein